VYFPTGGESDTPGKRRGNIIKGEAHIDETEALMSNLSGFPGIQEINQCAWFRREARGKKGPPNSIAAEEADN